MLAGLCSAKNLDHDKQTEAWQYVDAMMASSSPFVADTKKGTLWQPIEKLYKKATASRKPAAAEVDLALAFGTDNIETGAQQVRDASANNKLLEPGQTTVKPYMADDFNMAEISSVLESDQWLDWDALVADMDVITNQNNTLWV